MAFGSRSLVQSAGRKLRDFLAFLLTRADVLEEE